MAALTTASGTRIERLTSLDSARAFLDRYGPGGHQPDDGDRAWGAFEGTGPMVGIGILGAVRGPRSWAWIAVTPERRRLGVGCELLGAMVAAASGEGLWYLTYRHPAGEAAPERLARALGLAVARRVADGMVETVAVLARKGQALDEQALDEQGEDR